MAPMNTPNRLAPAAILLSSLLLVPAWAGAAEPEDLDKELRLAAMVGDVPAATALIDQGADVNAANQTGKTALMMAAETGDVATIALLLGRGAEVNARTVAGCTALTFAAENGNIGSTALLIERGANVHDRTRAGWDSLMIAARYGIRDMVGATPVSGGGPQGLRPGGPHGADASRGQGARRPGGPLGGPRSGPQCPGQDWRDRTHHRGRPRANSLSSRACWPVGRTRTPVTRWARYCPDPGQRSGT